MIRVALDRRWRVRLVAEIDLPFGGDVAWESLRDFERFACLDLFHHAAWLDRPGPEPGAALVLEHRLAGVGFARVGRVLWWRDGESYAFSDLSCRGPRVGFPHIYVYQIVAGSRERCRFRIEVRGQWTARFIPRLLVRAWMWLIMLKIRASAQAAFLLDELTRRGDACDTRSSLLAFGVRRT